MPEEKIALWFVPANDGDHLIGVPARDLTEAEVAELAARHPALLRDATAPHPATGQALYQDKQPKGRTPAAVATTAAPSHEADDGGR